MIERENFYINLLKPEYNILLIAGSSLGYKHSKEAIEKIRYANIGRKHSEETLKKFKTRVRSLEHTSKLRNHLAKLNLILNKKKGFSVKVLEVETGKTHYYESIRTMAKEFNTNHTSIRNYIKSHKLYKGKYKISLNSQK